MLTVVVGLVVTGLTCAIRPGRLHRSDLRTPRGPGRWGAALRCARRDPLSVVALAAHAGSTAPSGSIAVLQRDGERVLVLSGEIDVHTVQTFEARTGPVGQGRSSTTPVTVVDTTAVTFIDCCGLNLLVRSTQSARDAGRRPVLHGLTPPVHRLLQLTGHTTLFSTDPT